MILQQDQPDDYVIATGITTSVRDFAILVLKELAVELKFEGEGPEEVGKVSAVSDEAHNFKKGQTVIRVDPNYYRPTEVDLLVGDATKARQILGWIPEYDLNDLVADMVKSDLELFQRDKFLLEGGHQVFNYNE